jgi:hypothetical protein
MKHTSGLCARFCAVIQPFENSGMSRNASGPTRCVNTPPSLTTTANEVLQWLGILVPQGRLTCPKTARTPHLWRTACPAMRLCSSACWALLVFCSALLRVWWHDGRRRSSRTSQPGHRDFETLRPVSELVQRPGRSAHGDHAGRPCARESGPRGQLSAATDAVMRSGAGASSEAAGASHPLDRPKPTRPTARFDRLARFRVGEVRETGRPEPSPARLETALRGLVRKSLQHKGFLGGSLPSRRPVKPRREADRFERTSARFCRDVPHDTGTAPPAGRTAAAIEPGAGEASREPRQGYREATARQLASAQLTLAAPARMMRPPRPHGT